MSWPAIIIIGITVFELGIHITKDGTPKDNYSFAEGFISACIYYGLLYWGGFFQ